MKIFGKLLNKFNRSIDETEQIDDKFYAKVIDELSKGIRDNGAVGKAIAQSNGDKGKFDSLYMKIRAKTLQDIYIQKEKKLDKEISNFAEILHKERFD